MTLARFRYAWPTCSSIPTETKASQRAADVAVVVLDEFHLPRKVLRGSREHERRDLLAGQVERFHLHAVFARHVQRQRAPPRSRLR